MPRTHCRFTALDPSLSGEPDALSPCPCATRQDLEAGLGAPVNAPTSPEGHDNRMPPTHPWRGLGRALLAKSGVAGRGSILIAARCIRCGGCQRSGDFPAGKGASPAVLSEGLRGNRDTPAEARQLASRIRAVPPDGTTFVLGSRRESVPCCWVLPSKWAGGGGLPWWDRSGRSRAQALLWLHAEGLTRRGISYSAKGIPLSKASDYPDQPHCGRKRGGRRGLTRNAPGCG